MRPVRLLPVFCLVVTPALPETAPHRVAAAQALVTQWAKIRHEQVRMESEWEGEKALLASTQAAMESRRQTLEDQKRTLLARARVRDGSQNELVAQNRAAEAGLKRAEQELAEIADALQRLRPRLPPRLSRGLEMAFRSLAAADLPAAERSQHVAAILKRCELFDQVVTWGEEPWAEQGGGEKLIEVVYWGLSCAYGLDRPAGKAYVGRPDAERWIWQETPDIAPAVAELVAQARDQTDPAFVALPARIAQLPEEGEGTR